MNGDSKLNPWRGIRGLPGEVWVLFTVALINRAGTMALPFLVLYLTRAMQIPAETAGLTIVVYGAGALLTAPLAGRLCDRIGPVRVMQGSLFLSGSIMLAYPLVSRLPMIMVMTFLLAFVAEALRPANLTAVTEWVVPERRKSAFALIRLAINLGMSVGPAAGGFLALVSFPALFVVDGATSILAGVVLTYWSGRMRHGPAEAAAREGGGLIAEPGSAAVGGLAPAGVAPGGAAPAGALSDGRFLWFLLAMIPVMVVFFQHEGTLPLYLVRDLGLPESVYGMMFTINTGIIILLEVPLNLAMIRWPHGPTLALGAFLCGAGFGGLAFSRGVWSVAATVVVWTFGEMVLLPASAAYAADSAPPRRRGQYMGLYTMTFSLAFAGGPWLGILVLERFGPVLLWAAAFACGVLSAAMMWGMRHAEG